MSSQRTLVYDAPTRVFHWLFAGLFITAYTIASLAEHSPEFPLHMLAGLLLTGLVVLRLLWGLAGTRHARFTSFALRPGDLLDYFRGIFTGASRRWAGHNPASSWSALLMIGFAAGLAITGLLMTTRGGSEAYEEVHELLANSFLVVALLHVAGVILHSARYRDGFALSMVDGSKQEVPEEARIPGSRPIAALSMLGLVAAGALILWNGYEPRTSTLTAFGTTLNLAEDGEAEGSHGVANAEHEEDGDDD
jgi:cytochrome b